MFTRADSRINANFWDIPVLYGENGDILIDENDPRRRSSDDVETQNVSHSTIPEYLKDDIRKRSLGLIEVNRESIPVLHVRGSFYEVGFKIGRTFSRIIQNYIDVHRDLKISLTLYETPKGKQVFDSCYDTVCRNYPEHIRELKGISAGSDVPFYKLFLLHMEDIMLESLETGAEQMMPQNGSTTVIVTNSETQLLGHIVDHSTVALGNVFIVHAIINECCPEQEFTALSIGGMLPGHTMGFNSHGLVFAVDPVPVLKCNEHGIPRTILSRAILAADTHRKLEKILECAGSSIANGMAVSASTLLPRALFRRFECYEVGPKYCSIRSKSMLAHHSVQPPKYNLYYHTNKFQQITNVREKMHKTYAGWVSSKLSILKNHDEKTFRSDLLRVLGDSSVKSLELRNIFTSVESRGVVSVAVGVFDFNKESWFLYLDNPAETEPILTIPLTVRE